MKILTIVGARPQFVKAAVVSRAIAANNQKNSLQLTEVIVHTGQHYDHNMSEVFFEEMQIPRPDYNLGIGGGSHGAMTGRMLEGIEQVIQKEVPDLLLVYGDTNSTLAGALAAVKLHVPVAHVEAGLRSYNMRMPEEVNRILTDRVSCVLFCPTHTAVENLRREGLSDERSMEMEIHQVGDVMYDAALYYEKGAEPSKVIQGIVARCSPFYLATIHRAENTDHPGRLESLVRALRDISRETRVVLPLHPRTRKLIDVAGLYMGDILVMEPVGYLDMLFLLRHCQGVFTDSGGLQKEAYFFNKPCLTLREETEWVELVQHGFNTLTGADYDRIRAGEKAMRKRSINHNLELYGDGKAGEKIVAILADYIRR